MKALTIQQPYPHLIFHHQSELPDGAIQKRVENRIWETSHRGRIAIHAGKSFAWFKYGDWPVDARKESDVPDMAFGAIVGVADLVACLTVEQGKEWIATHHHANGPYLWILANVYRLSSPVPIARGQLGLWTLDEATERLVNQQEQIFIPFEL